MQCKCTEYSTVHVTPVSLWPVHEDVIIDYRLGPNLDPDNTPWNVKQSPWQSQRTRGVPIGVGRRLGCRVGDLPLAPRGLGRAPLALIALAPQSYIVSTYRSVGL